MGLESIAILFYLTVQERWICDMAQPWSPSQGKPSEERVCRHLFVHICLGINISQAKVFSSLYYGFIYSQNMLWNDSQLFRQK